MSTSAKMPETSWWTLHGTEVQSWSGTSRPFLQWHMTLQVDKQHEKLKGLNAISQNPFNSC